VPLWVLRMMYCVRIVAVQVVTTVMANVIVVTLTLGDCVTIGNFILHYPFVKYCEFELQMGIKYVAHKFSIFLPKSWCVLQPKACST